ncbi:MAG: 2-oxoacid:ferredoxin oxidoreductase subunit gamma [Tissierellia bacterium]|jgi:2-oxoglutarate ferredoxin oxidoreductase subunit gamma|nr:2-oxoacid:ferredoxin oxidoreductase subunit gamma [Tissierellia bacterium]
MKRLEFSFSGTGGQGVILLGVIMAETAINEGLNALQSQCYGPEARGGASRCEVIISDEEIYFPKVQNPNYVLCLSQAAANKYAVNLKEEAVLILDDRIELNAEPGTSNIYYLPILDTARNEIGKEITANIVSLGILQEITKLFSKEAMITSVLHRVPKGTEAINTAAIEAGVQLVKQWHEKKS